MWSARVNRVTGSALIRAAFPLPFRPVSDAHDCGCHNLAPDMNMMIPIAFALSSFHPRGTKGMEAARASGRPCLDGGGKEVKGVNLSSIYP